MRATKHPIAGWLAVACLSAFPLPSAAQQQPSDCVELGALAWDNWTAAGAGGTGLPPAGLEDLDYVRCKACHGWDRRGLEGGYVRRSRTAERPNAGAGDGDAASRAIVTGAAAEAGVLHAGSGRSYADGSGSWVPLDAVRSAANTAAHARGYTLGNQHPDFSANGPNAQAGVPSALQVGCLVEFLNFEDGDPSRYFERIDPDQDPVLYTVVASADAAAGDAWFGEVCEQCHTLNFVLEYLQGDGKFSELAHKVRWGIPDSPMGRSDMGDPTAQDVANLLAYLQQAGGTGFRLNPGLTGTWWNSARAGEGFLLEFGYAPPGGDLTLFASFYTYDDMGNQAWLVAQPAGPVPASGDSVDVDVFLVRGPMWGDAFDPGDRDVMAWGSGTFRFAGCASGHVSLAPGAEAQAMGYTELAYDLTRDLLESGIACPTPTAN